MKNKKFQSFGKKGVIVKAAFFLIILFVLNLTTITPSMGLCWDCRDGLGSFPLHLPYWATPPHWPYTIIRSDWPAIMVFGNLVDSGENTHLEISPLGNFNSTDITEQSFRPAALSTNNSNQNCSKSGSIIMQQFWTSNNWGLARFGKRVFIAAMPLISANTGNIAVIAPYENPSQNFQSTTEIPSGYIFYKWAFFILALWTIITGIFDLIQLIKR